MTPLRTLPILVFNRTTANLVGLIWICWSICILALMPFVVLGIQAHCRRAHDNIVIARPKKPSNVDNITSILSASVMTRAISRRGLLEPDNRPNVVKKLEFQAAQNAAFGGRRMDITTLLIIVVLIMLLGGGGWYGRGRWY